MNVNLILRLEAVAFTGFGLVFFLIPEVWNDGIFGWEGTTILFARIIGAAYLGLAVLAWKLGGRDQVRIKKSVGLPTLTTIGRGGATRALLAYPQALVLPA